MKERCLEIRDLFVQFQTKAGEVPAVCSASLSVKKGEILALAGESGSGKSALCRSVIRLLPQNGKILSGTVTLEGKRLDTLPERSLRKIRGKEVSMVFQEPAATLDPTLPVGRQLTEVLRIHDRGSSREERKEKALQLLGEVGLKRPEQCYLAYPGQLSGGMCQRAAIAIALSAAPGLLLADEPTTALDVTIQAEILKLLRKLREKNRMSILFVTHDLGVAAQLADRIAIMKEGRIVETGTCQKIFSEPEHPYTKALIRALPYYQLLKRKNV